MLFKLFFLTLFFNSYSVCQKNSYYGYALLRITPTTDAHLEYLLNLNAKSKELDFWLRTTSVNHAADVMVAPSALKALIDYMKSVDMPYITLIDDIGRKLEEDAVVLISTPRGLEFYSTYQSSEATNRYIQGIADKFPGHTRVINIGTSYEGRTLQVLRISSSMDDAKQAIWIQGGAHAREQIGPPVVTYIAEQMASSFGCSSTVSKMVNSFDWYFMPILNPDGNDYCQTTDRLWRKTRSRNPNKENCIGVDANRNWDIEWNGAAGSSSNPCSHNYAGPEPFSEPETRAVADFLADELGGRLLAFLDFHSYSQRWLSPWGYTSDLPPNFDEQKRLGEIATAALHKVNGTRYSVGSTGTIMYTVTGGARDWAYDVMGAEYSYVIELRDLGEFGFVLPRRFILPTANETWAGILAMGLHLIDHHM